MNLSSLFKQLKKRLRQKRRWLSLGFFIVAAAVGLFALYDSDSEGTLGSDGAAEVSAPVAHSQTPALTAEQQEVMSRIRASDEKRNVFVHQAYVCGEETRLLGRMTGVEIGALHQENPSWRIALSNNGDVTFTETVDDLSPYCKNNAYFGVDKDGNLTLFEGPPVDEKVIRTFFQLNMGYLESALTPDTIDQLKDGIRVLDMAEYNSVLSTFSDFAVEETERVMKPAD